MSWRPAALPVMGAALVAVFFAGLVLPSSIVEYPRALAFDTPLNHFYPGHSLQTTVLAVFGALSALYLAAIYLAGRQTSAEARRWVVGVCVLLAALSVFAYPSGSRDIFKNISDSRTLWVHHANPLTTPPSRFPGDPLLASVTQSSLQRGGGYYGAAYYVLAGPAALLGGSSVLGNLIAFKTLNALFLLAGVWLAGKAAAALAPGRELQAMVLLGWNPLLLYEGVVNAHNDLLMGIFALGACYLGARAVYSSFVTWGLSAGVKYATGLMVPVFLAWHWRNSPRRRALLAAAAAGLGLLVVMLVRGRNPTNLGIFLKFPAVNTPYSFLLTVLQPRIGYERATDVAQMACIALLALSLLGLTLFVGKGPRALYTGSFWALAAIAAFGVSYLWPWYFLWFAPIAAALAGRPEARLAAVASVMAVLTYAVYPYRTTGPGLNYLMLAMLFVSPAVYGALDRVAAVAGGKSPSAGVGDAVS